MTTVKWLSYDFTVCQMEPAWNHVSGVYIFSGIKNDRWHAYYIGQADSFKTRLVPSHEQWFPARRLGATHVHAIVVPQAPRRDKIERELIAACQPPLNTQYR